MPSSAAAELARSESSAGAEPVESVEALLDERLLTVVRSILQRQKRMDAYYSQVGMSGQLQLINNLDIQDKDVDSAALHVQQNIAPTITQQVRRSPKFQAWVDLVKELLGTEEGEEFIRTIEKKVNS